MNLNNLKKKKKKRKKKEMFSQMEFKQIRKNGLGEYMFS